jgi:hypothetical protein
MKIICNSKENEQRYFEHWLISNIWDSTRP